MAPPLYFVPAGSPAADLKAGPLAYAFEGNIASREVSAGPGSLRGHVHRVGGEAVECGYWPNRQEWTPLGERYGLAWLGLAPRSLPTPADLARAELVDGYPIELPPAAGGWIVPLARVFPEGTRLPATLAIGPDGRLVRKLLPAFRALSAAAERVWRRMMADNGAAQPDGGPAPAPMEDLEAFELAAAALGVNYRLGPAEASALGILTTRSVPRILGLLADAPAWYQQRARAAAEAAGEEAAEPESGPADPTPPPAVAGG